MSKSAISIYSSAIATIGGQNYPLRSEIEPVVVIQGSEDPARRAGDTAKIAPSEGVVIYDYSRDGPFELFDILPTAEVDLWEQIGTPASGSDAKAALVWQMRGVLKAGRPETMLTDLRRTNSTLASHATDSGDLPVGATDAGEVDGRVHKLYLFNRGTADVNVAWERRS